MGKIITEDYNNITTFTQMKYWLDLGEIVALKFDDGDGYIIKKDNEFNMVMNSKNNKRQSETKGSWYKLKELFGCLDGVEMFVVKNAQLTNN